jgi:hypothetical protein
MPVYPSIKTPGAKGRQEKTHIDPIAKTAYVVIFSRLSIWRLHKTVAGNIANIQSTITFIKPPMYVGIVPSNELLQCVKSGGSTSKRVHTHEIG